VFIADDVGEGNEMVDMVDDEMIIKNKYHLIIISSSHCRWFHSRGTFSNFNGP